MDHINSKVNIEVLDKINEARVMRLLYRNKNIYKLIKLLIRNN